MPAKHSRKIYLPDTYYHVFNRGVEKKTIFHDEQDYKVFLTYLKEALSPPPDRSTFIREFTLQGLAFKGIPRQPKNFFNVIQLNVFCLMPNHFHFILKQQKEGDMKQFIQSVFTRYSMYINKKYRRVGALFQGRYKAIEILDDRYFIYLSRYIHRNPIEIGIPIESAYSSYNSYIGNQHILWIHKQPVLSLFKSNRKLPYLKAAKTYKAFVEMKDNQEDISIVDDLEGPGL